MNKLTLLSLTAAIAMASPALARFDVAVGIGVPYVAEAPPPPPAPVYEVAPPPPPGMFWVAGHQHWNGYRYVWTRGYYTPYRPHHVWVGAGWGRSPDGWRWHDGHWR